MQRALDTLLDVQAELEQPEVAELTTLRLDAKIVSTIRDLRAALGEEPYEPQE
jgi:hypothetical protein